MNEENKAYQIQGTNLRGIGWRFPVLITALFEFPPMSAC